MCKIYTRLHIKRGGDMNLAKGRRDRIKELRKKLAARKDKTLAKTMHNLIERKGSQLKSFIIQRTIKGNTVPEIAKLLDISYDNLRNYLTRVATDDFKQELKYARKYRKTYQHEKKVRKVLSKI